MKGPWQTVDSSKLPKHLDSKSAEQIWDRVWSEKKIYQYRQEMPRENTFVVDTPPPTVSGSLHIGHVFSYTHADIVTRYQRMLGKNIFYPMGWDDNGLPTERRVQNYFHVRCDVNTPYEPGLKLEEASAKVRKERPRLVSRQNFIELCHEVTRSDEKAFEELYRRIGLSVDWRQTYATIDDRCRKMAQWSFLDLHKKSALKHVDAPTMWDIDFQTAVAQAEVEDRQQMGAFHSIEFKLENSEQSFVIATTRPELLPACVGIACHPEDKRYKHLIGKNAISPLFFVPVPIFGTELADPEKGTGILMVCTFGDATDVHWWREQKLPLRQILGRNGRLLPVSFSSELWPSQDADRAQKFYSEIEGKTAKQAKEKIVDFLRSPTSQILGSDPALKKEPEPVQQSVKFFEKGERPLEWIPTRQWFVKLLDKKEALLKKGDEVKWHPDYMRSRFRNWTENLQLDWCISRQRYFGVPFPVWYRLNEAGEPLFSEPLLPKVDELPVDPMIHAPEGFSEAQRNQPGGFIGDPDVFDTWFTSSLTPQIGSHGVFDSERHQKLFPADMRPQAHEIIRTWAFYTIAKSLLHEDQIPWKNAVISGWILDPDRKKMSKSKGNALTPMHLLDEYSSDAVRYWASSARLGTDTAFDEQILKIGRRLVTKIYNASKFVLSQTADYGPITHPLDISFQKSLQALVSQSSKAMSTFNFAQSLQETEKFFWSNFTDTYIELVKTRARLGSPAERSSAVHSLRNALSVLLRLFAPSLAFITEEVWHWAYAEEFQTSIHTARWPDEKDFEETLESPIGPEIFETSLCALNAIHKFKTENGLSVGSELESLELCLNPSKVSLLENSLSDLEFCTRIQRIKLSGEPKLLENEVRVTRS